MNAKPQATMTINELDTVISISKDRVTEKTPGGAAVAIRIHFEVEGVGNFLAGNFNTKNGTTSAWLKPQTVLNLESRPGPGYQFSHWVIDNDFSGSNRTRRAVAARGMVIKAVFVPMTCEDIRC